MPTTIQLQVLPEEAVSEELLKQVVAKHSEIPIEEIKQIAVREVE